MARMSDSELDPTEIIAEPLAVGVVGWFVGGFVLASLVVRFLMGAWRWRGLRGVSLLSLPYRSEHLHATGSAVIRLCSNRTYKVKPYKNSVCDYASREWCKNY